MLRSSTAPDPEQDQGEHHFAFAIMPHTGRLIESGVVQDAFRFTNDLIVRQGSDIQSTVNLFLSGPGKDAVIIDAVKRGEDDERNGERSVVVRMYETLGGRSRCTLNLWVSRLTKLIQCRGGDCQRRYCQYSGRAHSRRVRAGIAT